MTVRQERVDIVLHLGEDGKMADAEVVLRRAVLAASVVEGKTVAEALRVVPLLFALCGTAQ